MTRPPRVFLGLTEIAGYYANLARGFRELGLSCSQLDLSAHPFAYGSRTGGPFAELARRASRARRAARSPASRAVWSLCQQAAQVPLFAAAVPRHDVFILGFNSIFVWKLDLPLLKRLGKKIIFIFHGTDVRPSWLDGGQEYRNPGLDVDGFLRIARSQCAWARWVERYADVVLCLPTYGHFLRKPFVPLTAVGIPSPRREPPVRSDRPPGAPVRLLHAPSAPGPKGSAEIRTAVVRLKAKGLPVELTEVVGQPNQRVLEEIARCDIVVDQAYSDTSIAGLAAEAATMGRPAVVGTYATEELRRLPGFDRLPPTELCEPEAIEEAIERLVRDRDRREDLGRRARAAVERDWAPSTVAKRLLELIEGRWPQDGWCDPADIRYLHGYGRPQERVREILRRILRDRGPGALLLQDKPDLERAFVEFASR